MTKVRLATRDDAAALEAFIAANDPKWIDLAKSYIACAFSNDYRRPVFVLAEEDSQIVGIGAISEELFTVRTWGISWVLVEPSKRGKGIGTQIIQFCLAQIASRTKAPVTVILNTYPGRTGLYDRLGFTKAGQDHELGWYMLKVLS
jgi:GNAT superfamily N-acetyltransferase